MSGKGSRVGSMLDTNVFFWWIMDEVSWQPGSAATQSGAERNRGRCERRLRIGRSAIKVGLGKWPEAQALLGNFEGEGAAPRVSEVPICRSRRRMRPGHCE